MEYQPITKDDINQIIDLTMEHLTHGNYISDEILCAVDARNYFGIKAVEDGKIIGFNTVKRGVEFTLPHPEIEEVIRRIAPEATVFNGDSFYVDSKYRRRGIGRELTFLARDQMIALGGRYFLGELWVHPDGVTPASTPNSYYGKTIFERRVPFFYRELPRYGMCCPICGEDCRCDAVVRLCRFEGDAE